MFLIFQWWAHESLILSVGWNASNNLIVSGDEDGYIKVNYVKLIFPFFEGTPNNFFNCRFGIYFNS